MDSIIKLLRRITPDFKTARQERSKIRNRCRNNLKALERDDDLRIINTDELNIEHLYNRTEKTCVQIDHLIKEHGSLTGPGLYKLSTSKDFSELEEALQKAVKQIWRTNSLSLVVQAIFSLFVGIVIGGAVFLGIVGIDAIVDGLRRFV